MVRFAPLRKILLRFSLWGVLAAGAVLGVLGWHGLDMALEFTSRDEFCAHCHRDNATREWQESVHYRNARGMRVGCAQCHIPHEFGPKMVVKIGALGDVWSFFQGTIDTPEKYEAKRLQMARTVWARLAARGSQECVQCHDIEAMTNPDKPFIETTHRSSQKTGKPCAECHKGVAHLAPEEPETADEGAAQGGAAALPGGQEAI